MGHFCNFRQYCPHAFINTLSLVTQLIHPNHSPPPDTYKMCLRRSISLAFLSAFLLAALISLPQAAAGKPPYACDAADPATRRYGFCRRELPIRNRARDLVARLTLEEKVSQLVNTAASVPRLGIPAYEWWSEALHGVADAGPGVSFKGQEIPGATSFPQVILTAASFDNHLWYRIGQVIGIEARGVYNAGQAKGMTFWAPNINIFRDPRWGRGQETPGEDPLVTGKYSVAYVRGVQGDAFEGGRPISGDSQLLASACCKHFTAYDLDRWHNITRYVFDAHVTAQDLADTYQPPFENCIKDGRASGVMCAYNRVNGVPSCANFDLLTTTARGKWGFQGYITSDCDAVSIIHDAQGYAKTPEDAVVDVLNAGMDVNCGTYLYNYTKSAVMKRKLEVSKVDRALRNLFAVRMRLGLFDGNPAALPFGKIGPNEVCSKKHQDLALEAALNGIVLLKNDAKLLPLPKRKTISLAVIGPNANVAETLLGNYHGPGCKSVTPLQALRSYVSNIKYNQGCDNVACSSTTIEEATAIARAANYVVLFMGLDLSQEREDFDRVSLVLPGRQQSLIEAVAKAAKKPVVLVLLCGGPVDVSFAKYNHKIGSIVWAGYPGESGANAIAQILFGDHNPGGKLPVTWYPKDFIKVPMTDMRMRSNLATGYPGRTYRFYKGEKVFEFGHGLSYTTYSYEFISLSKEKVSLSSLGSALKVTEDVASPVRYAQISDMRSEFCERMKLSVAVGVMNKGDIAGKHPVLLFVRHEGVRSGRPMKQLIGFKSVSLGAGERSRVEFSLSPCEHLAKASEDGLMEVEEGTHFLMVGDQEYPINVTA